MKRFTPIDRTLPDRWELWTRDPAPYSRWKFVFAGTYSEVVAEMATRPARVDFNIRPEALQPQPEGASNVR